MFLSPYTLSSLPPSSFTFLSFLLPPLCLLSLHLLSSHVPSIIPLSPLLTPLSPSFPPLLSHILHLNLPSSLLCAFSSLVIFSHLSPLPFPSLSPHCPPPLPRVLSCMALLVQGRPCWPRQ